MKNKITLLTLIFASVIFSSIPCIASSEKRIALIMGNANYTHGGTLKNPVNDVKGIKVALKELNFVVIDRINCDQKAMKKAIDEFGEKLKGFDIGLFFYAGHGIQVNGINYLIPVDASLDNEKDVEYDCVRADRVLSEMENAGSKTNIVILDACRNNPFERSWSRGVKSQGLAFMDAPSGSIIAYATSPGKTASDGSGNNGIYTSAILKHIRTPGLTIEEMFKQVRISVEELSQKKQIPWESTSLKGKFYFNPEEQRGVVIVKKQEKVPDFKIEQKYIEQDETPKDNRFILKNNETVLDTKTGLIWAIQDNGKAITWWDANLFCKTFRGGGFSYWRLPTIDELSTLYDTNSKNKYGFPITELINIGECCPWSSEVESEEAAYYFNFNTGKRDAHRKIVGNFPRVLPVTDPKYHQILAPKIIDKNDPNRFFQKGNGVVLDKLTDLEWIACPKGNSCLRDLAQMYISHLDIQGGGWRMPTVEELASLYQKGVGQKNINPYINLQGFEVWSIEITNDGRPFYFDFLQGISSIRPLHGLDTGTIQGFAVRFKK
ncbi:MAG: caspase family protein [Desulfobacterales bacterium]|nr:caspase family protein [Desulfobacterales bacterium]